jgi:hypothetical protein
MERIQILIGKLQEQVQQNASPSQLLVTVQMLQNEIYQLQVSGNHTLGTSKVAVMLPKTIRMPIDASPAVQEEPSIQKYAPVPLEYKHEPVVTAPKQKATPKKQESARMLFDPLLETPTLSHQAGVKEINELAVHQSESLNDRLKQEQKEVVEVLKHEPIKDLRKAIGINDRFVFINDLFRGDEPMYERSIKTINSFYIFQEAEYWINRELIVKLGWDRDNDVVQHFYQLVRRRFSSM